MDLAVVVSGALMIVGGIVLGVNAWGAGDALWRFWSSSYSRFSLRPVGSPRFVRFWFAACLGVIGAGWIYTSI